MTEITAEKPRRQQQRKRDKRDVNGWLVLDKPVGMTSTHAVSVVKRAFQAKRAGHAGTLDPLASGLLPIALGEATKTVPFVMDGRKIYRFTVRWGEERDTDDAEGRVAETSAERPSADAIRALLPRFTGRIEQVPPRFSAVKIEGERAYDLARDGEVVELAPRTIEVHRLELVETPDPDHTVLAAECGKGTYVRALARDLGRLLGCFGHVSALRRTAVGSFTEDIAVSLETLQRSGGPVRADTTLGEASGEQEATGEAQTPAQEQAPAQAQALVREQAPVQEQALVQEQAPAPEHLALPPLLPVEAGLAALPALRVSPADAGRLARGQAVLLRGRDAPVMEGWVSVSAHGALIALAEVEKGELRPRRIFNLPRA